jgi:4-amino-4-deoxy-L-arabinose transferase-like glycosyltransferase
MRALATPTSLPPRAAALMLALLAALALFRLGDVPLLGPDEPRYARVAAEMHRRGDWVTPTLQGRPWLEKPALYYWLAGAAFSVLGETEAAARLPSVLAALVMAGATALFGARLFGTAAGLQAGFVLATALLPFPYARAASMDMLVAAGITVCTGLVGLRVLGIAGPLAAAAAGAAAGLAVLAKGPLGLLLPLLVLVSFAAVRRDGAALKRGVTAGAVLAFLVVAAPWYGAILHAQGRAFVDVFLLDHNVARFTSTVHRHPGPPYYYLPILLIGLFPWTGLLAPALASLRWRAPRDLFVLCWLAAPLLFLSAAGSKLPGYVLPCLAPLALLLGRAAAASVAPAGPRLRAAGVAAAALAAAGGAGTLLLRARGDPAWLALVPLTGWTAVVAGAALWRSARDPGGTLAVLRVGGAGLLLLLAFAAPPVLEARESGRSLFVAAQGREVLAFGAWRTAWMAGYWYNDGRVREVGSLDAVAAEARGGSVLVLAGPAQQRELERAPGLRVRRLARGPRANVLLRVEALSASGA